jgi:hypothetical protein
MDFIPDVVIFGLRPGVFALCTDNFRSIKVIREKRTELFYQPLGRFVFMNCL